MLQQWQLLYHFDGPVWFWMFQEEWSGTAVHQYPERTATVPLHSTHLCMGDGLYHPI